MKFLALILVCISFGALAQSQIDKKQSEALKVDFTAPPSDEVSINWITPEQLEVNSASNKVNIKLGISGSQNVVNVHVYLNGKPVEDRGFTFKKADDYDQVLEKSLKLSQGKNEIKMIFEDSLGNVYSDSKELYFTFDALANSTITDRRDYALIIATSEYQEWNDLTNPVFDAETIEKDLKENYGFETEILLNPTKTQLLSKIREYSSKSYLDQDQLFIFIAGHGQFDPVFTEGYTVCSNSKKNDPTKESYISHSTLRTYVSNIPCNHILLTMDVCFGGTFDQSIAQQGTRGEDDTYSGISNVEFIGRKLQYKTRKYLTSGGKEYVPDGRPNQHSPFARQFLKALRNFGGEDNILTIGELISFVEKVDPQPMFGDFQGDQAGSDFIFIAK
jgi:hypothetical protein